MDSNRKTERLDAGQKSDITRAATILQSGGTVAFPTETVYGLGANALSPESVEQIFVAKQRPHWDPLIVHVCDMDMLQQVTRTPLHPTAWKLIQRFWPGPLTLLLPREPAIPDSVAAGRPLVGVRMPAHPVALQLIREAGVPIAAPSANTFGHTSPTTAAHVLADLDGRIDAILDGGPTTVGLESTVAEIDDLGILIYRPGGIGLDILGSLHDVGWVRLHTVKAQDVPPESLPSPGVGIRHYAPRARLVLVEPITKSKARTGTAIEQTLVDAIDRAKTETSRVAVMLPKGWNPSCADLTYPWGSWYDLDILAQRLYSGLRALDDSGATIIICPIPKLPGIGDAIRDRLQKAAR